LCLCHHAVYFMCRLFRCRKLRRSGSRCMESGGAGRGSECPRRLSRNTLLHQTNLSKPLWDRETGDQPGTCASRFLARYVQVLPVQAECISSLVTTMGPYASHIYFLFTATYFVVWSIPCGAYTQLVYELAFLSGSVQCVQSRHPSLSSK
jgi:hypothetical protein